MYVMWSTLLSAILGVVGLVFLVKSIANLITIYTARPTFEWIAQSPACYFDLTDTGIYEISVKRPSIFGMIPKRIPFEVSDRQTDANVPVTNYNLLASGRRDMSGNRIIPIAEFTVDQPGAFRLFNPVRATFNPNDKILISPKPSTSTVFLILTVLFSSFLFIGGLVFFILMLVKK